MANRVSTHSLPASTSHSLPPSTAPSTSSLLTPALLTMSAPSAQQVDASVMDYLLIEMVRTLRESEGVARKRREEVEREMGLPPKAGKAGKGAEEDEQEEALRVRLERIGAHVGANLVEKLSLSRPRFSDPLDSVKFLCKDVWPVCFGGKQVDNLRTNHRGVYVLQDASFRPVGRVSSPQGSADALRRAKLHLAFPCGIIRGALGRMGLHGTVVAEVTTLPACTFQIKLPKA